MGEEEVGGEEEEELEENQEVEEGEPWVAELHPSLRGEEVTESRMEKEVQKGMSKERGKKK